MTQYEQVLSALEAHDMATSKDIAAATGIHESVCAKHLRRAFEKGIAYSPVGICVGGATLLQWRLRQ